MIVNGMRVYGCSIIIDLSLKLSLQFDLTGVCHTLCVDSWVARGETTVYRRELNLTDTSQLSIRRPAPRDHRPQCRRCLPELLHKWRPHATRLRQRTRGGCWEGGDIYANQPFTSQGTDQSTTNSSGTLRSRGQGTHFVCPCIYVSQHILVDQ